MLVAATTPPATPSADPSASASTTLTPTGVPEVNVDETVKAVTKTTNDLVTISKINAANTSRYTAHAPDSCLIEADRITKLSTNDNIRSTVRQKDIDKLVFIFQIQSLKTVLTNISKFCHTGPFDHPMTGSKEEIGIITSVLLNIYDSLNSLSFIKLQEIDYWQALGCPTVLRNFISFETINSTFICKEEQSIMGAC